MISTTCPTASMVPQSRWNELPTSGHWNYTSAPLPAHELFGVFRGVESGLVSDGRGV